jgi:hypothetical protein
MRVKRMNRALSHSAETEEIHAARAILAGIYNSGSQIDN